MSLTNGLVVIGGCYAALNAAASARAKGYSESITMVSEERELPYQRPPLSKGFLLGTVAESSLPLRAEKFYRDHRIELVSGSRVVSIDRAQKSVETADGSRLDYQHLVLAVGARPRTLAIPGVELDGVVLLRSLSDARALRERIAVASNAVVVGGGYIGLEVAAVLASLGKHVTVLEAQDRLLARTATPQFSEYVAGLHRSKGVALKLGTAPQEILGAAGRAVALTCSDGVRLPADIVIVAVGVVPNIELAQAADLPCRNGIVVDRHARTQDESILAAGDCSFHPNSLAGAGVRLESVQNAIDQAKVAGAVVAGGIEPYDTVPWFWSDQFDSKLQMTGIPQAFDAHATRGSIEEGRFSFFHFSAGQLAAVESVNRPADQLIARKLMAARAPLTPEMVSDPTFDLGAFNRP